MSSHVRQEVSMRSAIMMDKVRMLIPRVVDPKAFISMFSGELRTGSTWKQQK